jgi:DnaJ domain
MTFGSFIAQMVCPALLPPADAVDFEYFDVLRLPKGRSTTVSEVRKAYKQLSLQLHPDKIAQRGGNREEAASLYEQVQEAADVLSDDTKRRVYISYNYSVARYRFVHDQHGWMNPPLLYENLKQASCIDRTRLWCVTTMLLVLVLLQPILIAIKVNSIGGERAQSFSNVSWWLILIPCWILYGFYIILRSVLVAFALRDRLRYGPPKSLPRAALGAVLGVDPAEHANDGTSNYQMWLVFLSWCESVALLVGIILLVLQWDRPLNDKKDWIYNAIPFYCIVFFVVTRHLMGLQQVRYLQTTMRSVDSVQQEHGVDWEDATEEQRATILESCIVVQPDPAAFAEAISLYREAQEMLQLKQGIPVLPSLDEEEIESIRVHCSEEYRISELAKTHYHFSLGTVVVVYVTFIALTTAKLQQKLEDTSWWIIFIPFWISYGLPFLQYTLICCCSGSVPDYYADANTSGEDVTDAAVNTGIVPDSDHQPADTTTGRMESTSRVSDIVAEKEKNEPSAKSDLFENSPIKDAELRSSVQWASPDGSMDEFISPSKPQPPKDGESSGLADTAENDIHDEKPQGMDEETFRRFQHHVEESEREAIEQKVKAFAGCCNICFQMTILCLLVAKLEHDYNAFVVDENVGTIPSDGFNAMWVLFPVFLMSGCVLLFCTCCICVQDKEEFDPPVQSSASNVKTDEATPIVPSVHNEVEPVTTNEVTPTKSETTAVVPENVDPQTINVALVHDLESGGGAIDDLD